VCGFLRFRIATLSAVFWLSFATCNAAIFGDVFVRWGSGMGDVRGDGNRGAEIECRRIVVDWQVEYDIPRIVAGEYPLLSIWLREERC
jgi:hypothetical protein